MPAPGSNHIAGIRLAVAGAFRANSPARTDGKFKRGSPPIFPQPYCRVLEIAFEKLL
jgi:hypothetical protein